MRSKSQIINKKQDVSHGLLEELLEEIRSITVGSEWRLSLESVLSHLSIPLEQYYSYIYAGRSALPPRRNLDHFEVDSVSDLISLLEDHGITRARETFHAAGYFFSGEDLDDFLEFFLSVTMSRLQSHTVDEDLLDLALAGCMNPEDGFDFYRHSRFPVEELLDFAVRLYLNEREIECHHLSEATLKNHVQDLFHKKILRMEDLSTSLNESLRKFAVSRGMMKAGRFPVIDPKCITPELAQALAEMGFQKGRIPHEDELKTKYRSLVKQYHPDLNPEGEEKTRRLTTAYTKIWNGIYANR